MESEIAFKRILMELPEAIEGKMFGAKCIKADNGKVVAILWKNTMLFKLNKDDFEEALKLKGSKIGAHLYAPERPMKGWVEVPVTHSKTWINLTKCAIKNQIG
ncbi:MAG: hypothetical protein GXO84_07560 [Chlorobi bacterium]|nr:hypothetical protein [Chlorobiota bacterium]